MLCQLFWFRISCSSIDNLRAPFHVWRGELLAMPVSGQQTVWFAAGTDNCCRCKGVPRFLATPKVSRVVIPGWTGGWRCVSDFEFTGCLVWESYIELVETAAGYLSCQLFFYSFLLTLFLWASWYGTGFLDLEVRASRSDSNRVP